MAMTVVASPCGMLNWRLAKTALSIPFALFALAGLAPRALANIPATITRTNTLRMPSSGNAADGTLTTTVTYINASAFAAASANSVGLDKGLQYRLRTCVSYHLSSRAPVSSCAERDVDTRANDATVYTYAPPVRLTGQRPTTQPWGYFTAYSDVLYLSASGWQISAHSWPDDGLQGAGIPVAAQGQTSGALPANSLVALDGPFTAAINSGQPDSICTNTPAPSNGSPLPDGVTTSHEAFSGAPGYYEIGLPTGAYADQAPRGVMLVIHGGAWSTTGVYGVQAMRPDADRWRARGWETVNITYRPCGQSSADVLWFYDRARAWVGPDVKIAALGTSSGGHLALLIGASRPDLYAVVSQAGPTDLTTIQDEGVYDAATGLYDSTFGSRLVHNLAAAAFGEENLDAYSPAALASAMLKNTRVLQAFSADDAVVPYKQATDLSDAMRAANSDAYVENVQLATGTIPFAHGRVTQAALDDFYAREEQLVAPANEPAVEPSTR
jgi:acetyl esterase/lipase